MAKRPRLLTFRVSVPGLGRIHAGMLAVFALICLGTLGLMLDGGRPSAPSLPGASEPSALPALATGAAGTTGAAGAVPDTPSPAAGGWEDLQRRFFREIIDNTIPLIGLQSSEPPAVAGDRLWSQAAVYVLGFRPSDPLSLLEAGVPLFGQTPVAAGTDSRPPEDAAAAVPPPSPTPSPTTPPTPTPTLGTDPLLLGEKRAVVVAVYSTHSSESFIPDLTAAGKPAQPNAYVNDPALSVLRVGEELVRELHDKYQLGTVQIRTAHDADGYLGAYTQSATTVQGLLRDYPGLRMIIDLHRDSADRSETVIKVDGQDVARVMLIIGSGSKQLKQPNWQQNYAFARQLSAAIEAQYPGLCRGIVVKADRYNQHFSPKVLLFELGGHENSLQEELRTARILAKVIAGLLKTQSGT